MTNTLSASRSISIPVSVAIIVGVVSLVFFPIFILGVPDGYDLMQHMRFAGAYYDAILSGDFIPVWSARDNFGFGGIGIRYYPPLAYVVLALTKLATGNWFYSFGITTYIWGILGSLGIFFWMRRWTSDTAALIGAAFYAIIPYHSFQIYQAVLYAEFAASGILPFCFLCLSDLCSRRRWKDVLYFSVSLSLLILTHIPTAIIATLSLGLFGLLILDRRHFKDTVLKTAIALFASVAAVSFHVFKAVAEVDWVKHNSSQYFANGYYDYKNYLFPIIFSASSIRYIQKMLWHFDTIILITLLCFAVYFVLRNRAVVASSDKPEARSLNRAVILTGAFASLMLSIVTLFVWNNVSLLAKIQFPWRWLSVVSIMASVLFGIGASATLSGTKRFARLAGYPVLLFVCIVVFYDISQNILPSTPLDRPTFESKVAGMYDEEACDCWWPIWATQSAFENRDRVSAGSRAVEIERWDGLDRIFTVEPGSDLKVRIATFYHPYWKATLNGEAVNVSSGDDGTITILISEGKGEISLRFVEPSSSYRFRIVSLFTWAVFLLAGIILWRRGSRVVENA